MGIPEYEAGSALAPPLAAPQHKPRPLTLFLDLVARETAGDPARAGRILAGLRAYQQAERGSPPSPMPAIDERFGASLRDYGGAGPPLLVVPSLINPPTVLDLPGRSLLRWLAARKHRVLLLDWGVDVSARRSLSIGGHVTEILLPFAREAGSGLRLAGYCLGGTMALAAAALAPVDALVTIAAPWRFSGFPDSARRQLCELWTRSKAPATSLGVLPMEVLQSAFWSLDPRRTVGKFERFAELSPDGENARGFVLLEDWANDGPPVGEAAAREMFDDLFARDLPGSGAWRVGGRLIDPAALPCPALHIVSASDRIVPAASAPPGGERLELAPGHVGMVVGRRARESLWEPLDAWLSHGCRAC